MPTGNEATNLPTSSQTAFNLHAGRYRGLTWHDETDDVVWLFGCGWHESGSIVDAYEYLKNLDVSDTLLPTQTDYRLFYTWRETTGVTDFAGLIQEVRREGPRIREMAEGNPGIVQESHVANAIWVSVLVTEDEHEDHTYRSYQVRLKMPPTRPGVLPSNNSWQMQLAPAFLPYDSEISDWQWAFDEGSYTIVFEDMVETG